MKLYKLSVEHLKHIPRELKQGVLYISKEYSTAIHLCACGCGEKSVTPLGKGEWTLTETEGRITLKPSIGNWAGEKPYHAHYFITNNKVIWC